MGAEDRPKWMSALTGFPRVGKAGLWRKAKDGLVLGRRLGQWGAEMSE